MTRFTITGRLVQGDPHKPGQQRKDNAGQLKFRKDGQPDCPFYMAVAIPKDPSARFVIPGNPTWEEEKAKLDAAARAAWPNLFQQNFQRPPNLHFDAALPADCTSPKFANKILDGDGFDDDGKPYSRNDGWAGCWVVKVSNGFAPQVKEWLDGTGWADMTPHGRQIKLGDYVTVSGTVESNKSTQSSGMYMNFDIVSFEAEGERIIIASAVDANEALGSRGGQANPPASGQANNAHAGGAGGAAHGTAGSTTASDAPPYSGYREDNAPPPPPGDNAPPPPSGPTMTAKAGGKTYESFIAAGWTEDQLRQHGYIA